MRSNFRITEGLIDDRNRELWDLLNFNFEIEVVKDGRNNYSVYSIRNKATIFVQQDNINSASFTHELLHIYLRFKQIFISSELFLIVKENKRLSQFMSNNLLKHIGNCLDHIKTLPIFLKLGYDNSEFISDYHIHKLLDFDIKSIETNFYSKFGFIKYYHKKTIDLYIGKFFAAVACSNRSFDYDTQLKKLRKIDVQLFDILESFLLMWRDFNIDEDNPLVSYHTVLYNFEKKLDNWAKHKIII